MAEIMGLWGGIPFILPDTPAIRSPVVTVSGSVPPYTISVYVEGEDDGRPIAGEAVRLESTVLGEPARPAMNCATKADGYASFDLIFDGVECDAIVRVRAFEVRLDNLIGPSRHRENNRWFWLHLGVAVALVVLGVFLGFNREAPAPVGLSSEDVAYIRLSDPHFGIETVGRTLRFERSVVWWTAIIAWISLPITIIAVFRDDLGRTLRRMARPFRETRGERGDDAAAGTPSASEGRGVFTGMSGWLTRQIGISARETAMARLADWLTHRR